MRHARLQLQVSHARAFWLLESFPRQRGGKAGRVNNVARHITATAGKSARPWLCSDCRAVPCATSWQQVLRVPPEHRLHPQEVQSQIHPILMLLYVKNVVTGSGFGKAFQPHSCQEPGNQHRHFKTSHILPSNKPLCAVVRFFCFIHLLLHLRHSSFALSLSLSTSLSQDRKGKPALTPPRARACARTRTCMSRRKFQRGVHPYWLSFASELGENRFGSKGAYP